MGEFTNQSLKFVSDAVPEDTLILTRLVGEERISGLFRFELEMVSAKSDINLEAVLYEPARVGLELKVGDGQKSFRWYDGCVAEFVELEQGQSWTSYRAVFVPDLWKLDEFYRSRIYQGHTADTLVGDVLKTSLGFEKGTDFEFKLARISDKDDPQERAVYPWREYVVQFEETDLAFMRRWLEHEGIYFFFENDGTREKVVFADTTGAYKPVVINHDTFPYRPQGRSQSTGSTQEGAQAQEVLSLHCTLTRQPKTVALNDYNWRDPGVRLGTQKKVHDKGNGLQNEYNDHYKTEDQGNALAEVRAEEWSCRAKVFRGTSTIRSFRPGRTFNLEEHFRDDFNQSYLIVSVAHEAEQSINLEASTVTGANYQNAFEAIPAERAFRPERLTDWPAIRGVINAKIESAIEDDMYAFLDEHGRYRVRFPFDDNSFGDKPSDPGVASRWVRMAQPYAGSGGMHFPLVAGTEVLITHIDGDPDRPVISGAVPNPDSPSPTDMRNRTLMRMRSAGGSTVTMDDDVSRPGFVKYDETCSVVEDGRFRLGSSRSPGNPGGGSGGGLRQHPGELMFRGPKRPLPGPGQGSTDTESQSGAANSGDTDNNPDTPDVLTIEAALNAFTNESTALDDIVNKGRYVGTGESDDLKERYEDLQEKLGKLGLGSNPFDGTSMNDLLDDPADGLAPLSLGGKPSHIENIKAGWNKVLKKHPHFPESEIMLDAALKFEGAAFGSRARAWIGDNITFIAGDQYTYADVSNEASYGTGGKGWHYEDGDTDSYSEQDGEDKSESKHTGDKISKSFHEGESKSDDIQLGGYGSSLIRCGDTASAEIFVGAKQSTSIVLSDVKSLDLNISGYQTLDMYIGARQDISLVLANYDSVYIGLSAKNSFSMEAAGVTNTSLRVGDTMNTSIYVGNKMDTDLVLATKLKVDINLAIEDTLAVTMALRNKNEVVMAVDTTQFLTLAAQMNTGIFLGAKIDTLIALGVMMETKIAAAAVIETVVGVSKVEISAATTKDEIELKDGKYRLSGDETGLGKNITSLLNKVGT